MNIRPILAAALCLVPSALAAQDLVVDAVRNCVYYDEPAALAQKAAVLQLLPTTTYQVTVTGEAYLSDQTGAQADPFPGVILAYATNEEDGWAMRYRVARPGDTFEFRTSASTGAQYDFHRLAFFLDPYSNSPNRGSYTVRLTRK